MVSEEAVAEWQGRAPPREFLLVDPLDGTREFLAGRDEFTVNIALVRGGIPVVGIVAAPALGLIWRGATGTAPSGCASPSGEASAAPRRTDPHAGPGRRTSASPRSAARTSTRPARRFWRASRRSRRLACGSAIKFCRLAEGAADVYPRLAPTCEWDVAAGHAVLAAAGGVRHDAGRRRRCATAARRGLPRSGFIAWGDAGGRAANSGADSLFGEFALDRGPARRGRRDDRGGIGEEGRARLGGIEEIKPLAVHDPERRIARRATPRATPTGS